MWSDTVFAAERAHLLGLFGWGSASVLLGTALYAAVLIRRSGSALIRQFAIHSAGWGGAWLLVAWWRWSTLIERDLASAIHLDRAAWYGAGVATAGALGGTAFAYAAWHFGRRLGGVGAGVAVVVQALAVLVLTLRLIVVTAGGY
jgi:hypothetical protein